MELFNLTPTSDEDEDYEEVQHGLFPVLWARFEGDYTIDNRWLLTLAKLSNPDTLNRVAWRMNKKKRQNIIIKWTSHGAVGLL